MRIHDLNGSTKAIANAVAQIITFTSSDFPGNRTVALHLTMDAAGNTAADFTSIVLKAGGSPIYSLTGTQLRAFIESTSKGNYSTPTTEQCLTIPLYDELELVEEMADQQQFPYGQLPTLEIGLGAGSATGNMILGWTRTTVDPVYYPRLLAVAHGIPVAAQIAARMPFNTPDRPNASFRGFSVPSVGLQRAKCVVSGQQLCNVSGVARAVASGSMIQQVARHSQVNSISDPAWLFWRNPGPAKQGESYLELDLDGNQAAGGQIVIYDRIPQGG